MCEQCRAFDDEDDLDTLAAAFVARHGKPAPAKPAVADQHALFNRKPTLVLPPKKAAR